MKPILPGAPWLIAHRSMLSINQPRKITLNGQDYVLWQDIDGKVHALSNVCPHLQAPLSDGWICEERNTIVCPFHVLEFDGSGRLHQDGKLSVQAIAQPLELITTEDLIWTYGGFEPRLPIPELHQQIAEEYDFIGVLPREAFTVTFSEAFSLTTIAIIKMEPIEKGSE